MRPKSIVGWFVVAFLVLALHEAVAVRVERPSATCELQLVGQLGRYGAFASASLNCSTPPGLYERTVIRNKVTGHDRQVASRTMLQNSPGLKATCTYTTADLVYPGGHECWSVMMHTGVRIEVGVNTTVLGLQLLPSPGVHFVSNTSGCKQNDLNVSSVPTLPPGLLFFCGNYEVTLLQPVVQNVLISDQYHNAVLVFGGAVNASITGGMVAYNQASAMLVTGEATLHVSNTVITSNSAATGTGIIADMNSSVTISNCTFNENRAIGSVAASNSASSAVSSVTSILGFGGAIFASSSANVTIANSIITNCTATAYGGGIAALQSSRITLINCTVQFCNATSGAGAVAVGAAQLSSYNTLWKNNTCAEEGGGMLALGNATVTALDSRFVWNSAKLAGGGVSIGCSCGGQVGCSCNTTPAGGATVGQPFGNLTNCTFMQNHGGVGAYDSQGLKGVGGGLAAHNSAEVIMQNSTFYNNTADADGGAVWIVNNVNMSVIDSIFELNYVGSAGAALNSHYCTMNISSSAFVSNAGNSEGGAVHLGDSTVKFTTCYFVGNNGSLGGVISGHGNNSISFSDSVIQNSTAFEDCGVLMVYDSGSIILSSTEVSSNTATKTVGALCIYSQSSLIVDNDTRISNNSAYSYAGAMIVDATSSIVFRNSTLANNSVLSDAENARGGGLVAQGNSTAAFIDALIYGNHARQGGYAAVLHNAKITVTDSVVEANIASHDGGAVYVGDSAEVAVVGSLFTHNNASNGAALAAYEAAKVNITLSRLDRGFAIQTGGCVHVQGSANVTFVNSACSNSSAGQDGGGVYCHEKGQLNLIGTSTIANNSAQRDGGGICLMESSQLALSSNVSITQNQATAGQGGGLAAISSSFSPMEVQTAVHHNTAKYSQDVYVNCTRLVVLGNTSVRGFVSQLGSNAGWLPAQLGVLGHYDMPCAGVSVQAELVDGWSESFVGTNASDAAGLLEFELRVRKPPGNYTIKFTVVDDRNFRKFPPAVMSVEVRSCIEGEVTFGPDACQACYTGTYSFNPSNETCDECPLGASCPGGAFIVPQPGFWHSSPRSAQLHRCLNPSACLQQHNLTALQQDVASFGNDDVSGAAYYADQQCSSEYTGNLCAMCAWNHGSVRRFECRKCMASRLLIAVYVLGASMMLAFMKLLCHFNIADTNQAMQYPQDASDKLGTTELLRFLVLYSQWLLLVATLSGVKWPDVVYIPLQVVGWVWAPASPEASTVECLLQSSAGPGSPVPLPIAKVLFYLCMPIAMLAALLGLEACSIFVKRAVNVFDRLTGTAMVVAYFFLPSVVRTLFSLFTCVHIDQPVEAPYEAAAVGSFWMHDTNQLCFAGYHWAWALGLGIPLLFFVVLGLPAASAALLLYNRKRLQDLDFRRHYGFLFNSYNPSTCFWESIVMIQTISLVAVSVFGLSLGPFYQSLVMSACLALIIGSVIVAKPYAKRQANTVAKQSGACLLFTSFVAQSFLPYGDVRPGPVYGIVIGTVLLAVNLAFICSLLHKLVAAVEWNAILARANVVLGKTLGCTIPAVGVAAAQQLPTVDSAGSVQLQKKMHLLKEASKKYWPQRMKE